MGSVHLKVLWHPSCTRTDKPAFPEYPYTFELIAHIEPGWGFGHVNQKHKDEARGHVYPALVNQ